jgi:hypothetical protein
MRAEGKKSSMTHSRIQALESLGFEWDLSGIAWEDRLSELADYRKIHGHCNVPYNYSENVKLAGWVKVQRQQYKFQHERKRSAMTLPRIQALESLGFEWGVGVTAWEDRWSELSDFRKIRGHCNVPQNDNENSKLGSWVSTQRKQYRLQQEGKKSPMTPFRIQELESLGFEWGVYVTAWEDRFSELSDFRKIHGHCNFPKNSSENVKLAGWVKLQRQQYRLQQEGKTSSMTLSRIQALENLGFDWKPSSSRAKGPKNPSLNDEVTRVRERAVELSEHMQQHSLKKISEEEKSAGINSTSLLNPKYPTGMAKSNSTSSRVEPKTN